MDGTDVFHFSRLLFLTTIFFLIKKMQLRGARGRLFKMPQDSGVEGEESFTLAVWLCGSAEADEDWMTEQRMDCG